MRILLLMVLCISLAADEADSVRQVRGGAPAAEPAGGGVQAPARSAASNPSPRPARASEDHHTDDGPLGAISSSTEMLEMTGDLAACSNDMMSSSGDQKPASQHEVVVDYVNRNRSNLLRDIAVSQGEVLDGLIELLGVSNRVAFVHALRQASDANQSYPDTALVLQWIDQAQAQAR